MPPLPRLRIAALDDLARQLRFAPVETLRRQLERARQMAPEIDPTINYPEDWIVYRITGYRPQIEAPAMLVGEALLSDISALVERLSAAAEMTEAELSPEAYLDAEALCTRWSISRKTLGRYRRAGLVALRVMGQRGRPKLLFPMEAVTWFEERQAARLCEAQLFARIGGDVEARMLGRAERYARAGLSLNQAAVRIASHYGRGHETVRQLLRRTETTKVLFAEQGPPTARERRLIERAYWLWIDPAHTARHLGRSRASVQRVMTDGRAALLRAVELQLVGGGRRTAELDAASAAALESEAARRNLGVPGERDLLRFVHEARSTPAPAAARERSLALAYHALLARARIAIGGLKAHGAQAIVVDRIETDLRWAVRLKAALVRMQFGQLVRTFESSLQRPLEEVRTRLLAALIADGIAAMAQAVDSFEPRRGGRLAAPAGMALNRLMARYARERDTEMLAGVASSEAGSGAGRATARLLSSVTTDDWTLSLATWQRCGGRHWLEPDPRIRAGLSTLAEADQLLLVGRFGWNGPPMTHIELAQQIETTPIQIARRERRAARQAIAAARGGST